MHHSQIVFVLQAEKSFILERITNKIAPLPEHHDSCEASIQAIFVEDEWRFHWTVPSSHLKLDEKNDEYHPATILNEISSFFQWEHMHGCWQIFLKIMSLENHNESEPKTARFVINYLDSNGKIITIASLERFTKKRKWDECIEFQDLNDFFLNSPDYKNTVILTNVSQLHQSENLINQMFKCVVIFFPQIPIGPEGCRVLVNKSIRYDLPITTDFRISHINQLPDMYFIVRPLLWTVLSQSYNLQSLSQQNKDLCVIAYLLLASKINRLHGLGVFHSSLKTLYVPIFPYISIANQFNSLSISPACFLFKVSDYLGTLENQYSQKILLDIHNFVESKQQLNNSTIPYLPASLETQRLLLDRFQFLEILESILSEVNDVSCSSTTTTVVSVPTYKKINWPIPDMNDLVQLLENFKFPLLCKGRLAGGPMYSHEIGVAFNIKGVCEFANSLSLLRIKGMVLNGDTENSIPDNLFESAPINYFNFKHLEHLYVPPEFLVQQYIFHGQHPVLKIFVIGNWIHINYQRSIPTPFTPEGLEKLCHLSNKDTNKKTNIQPDCIIFNSSILKCSEPSEGTVLFSENEHQYQHIKGKKLHINEAVIWRLSNVLKKRLGTSLFGYDVLIEETNSNVLLQDECVNDIQRLVVVDINFFPSYSGVSDLPKKINQALRPF